ncbi:MAG: GNAT family N-acetyltransferase [Ginsengibacter sp.]
MLIHGDDFLLRPFQISDKQALAKHANNEKIGSNLRDQFPFPYTEADAEWFINFVLQKNNNPIRNFIIEINNEAAGAIEVRPGEDVYRLNAEIGYWLGEEHWGKGVMTRVIKSFVKYIFENSDIKRVFAIPFETSTASIRALEKAGFIKEATIKKGVIKKGKILDYYIYSITSF